LQLHLSLQNAQIEGNFYLQGIDAASQPVSVFVNILNNAEAKGFEVEILGQPYDGKIA